MVLGWTTSLEFFIYFLPYSKLLSLQIPANCGAKHRVIVTKHPKVIIQRHYQCANNKNPIVKPSRCILLASPRLNSKLCLLSSSTGLPKSPCVLMEEKIGCLQRVWGDGKHCTGDRETRVLKACVTLSKTLDCLCLILPSFKMCAFPPLPQFLKLNGSSRLLAPITLWNLVFILIIFQGLWASSCALFLSTRITTSTCLCNWFLGQEEPLDKAGLPCGVLDKWINAWNMDFLPPHPPVPRVQSWMHQEVLLLALQEQKFCFSLALWLTHSDKQWKDWGLDSLGLFPAPFSHSGHGSWQLQPLFA